MPTNIGRPRGPLGPREGSDTLLHRLLQPNEKRPSAAKRRASAQTPGDLGSLWALALRDGDKRDKKPGG